MVNLVYLLFDRKLITFFMFGNLDLFNRNFLFCSVSILDLMNKNLTPTTSAIQISLISGGEHSKAKSILYCK